MTPPPQVRGVMTDESACTPGSVVGSFAPDWRPSISACRCRQALAVYPQARAGRPQTPAQPWPRGRDLLTLLRVGFTEPPRSPGVLVVSYTAVSPLPGAPKRPGGLFSVA